MDDDWRAVASDPRLGVFCFFLFCGSCVWTAQLGCFHQEPFCRDRTHGPVAVVALDMEGRSPWCQPRTPGGGGVGDIPGLIPGLLGLYRQNWGVGRKTRHGVEEGRGSRKRGGWCWVSDHGVSFDSLVIRSMTRKWPVRGRPRCRVSWVPPNPSAAGGGRRFLVRSSHGVLLNFASSGSIHSERGQRQACVVLGLVLCRFGVV